MSPYSSFYRIRHFMREKQEIIISVIKSEQIKCSDRKS